MVESSIDKSKLRRGGLGQFVATGGGGGEKRAGMGRFLNAPGGISSEDAVQRGEDAVELLRPMVSNQIEKAVTELVTMDCLSQAEPPQEQRVRALAVSNEIVTMAGLASSNLLANVAQALFALIDELNVAHRWDGEAVDVHLKALRFAHAEPKADPAACALMLKDLARVRAHALGCAEKSAS